MPAHASSSQRRHEPMNLCARSGALAIAMGVAACAAQKTLPPTAGFGPEPTLPAPESSLIPTVDTAPARPWTNDEAPTPAAGFAVNAFARDLVHPRWLYVLPDGSVLVAETDAPPKPEDGKGIRGAIMKKIMKRAGSGLGSANRITRLEDADGDGIAETKTVFIDGLNSPFGMALVGDVLYVANTDSIVRFPYPKGATKITAPGVKTADLPGGPLNHHWTKNIIASRDGSHLYATVGSNSNVAENGIEKENGRACIVEIDLASGRSRTFATGLRNPNGLAWQPANDALWTVVNERDELGNDLVPDYLTEVKDGAFYGWPYSYYGAHVDVRVQPPRPDLVAKAVVPDYALGSHTASLGLAFYDGDAFGAHYRGGAFIGQHGSWNRRPQAGYKVIFVPFANGRPGGQPEDVLTGFVDEHGKARGRPVGVAVDHAGNLLVADDVGGHVWRVTRSAR